MNRSAFYSLFKKSFYSAYFILISSILSSQVPAITSFSPASGPVETTVTITGTNFDATPANNIVWFGAVRATVTAATTTELKVIVPTGTTYQPISVTAGGLTAYSSRPWDVSFSSIRSFDTQSLDTKIDFPAGSEPYAGAVCDIDVDGKPDLIFVNRESDNVSILRNVTDMHPWSGSSFEARYNLDAGAYPVSVATDDIDGDGKKDIVVANFSSNTISVFRNTSVPGTFGPGSFAAKVDFTAGGNPQCVIIADIDIDGKPDLIFTNYTTNTVSILKNTCTVGTIDAGSFAARVDFSTGVDPRFVVLGHIDTDVKPDLVVSNYADNTISVLRNKITAGTIDLMSFDARVNFTTGMNPYAVAIEDIDINGWPDVIVSNLSDNSISIFSNAGVAGDIVPGSLNDRVNFTTGAHPISFSIGDLDGDGKRDIAVANQFSNSISLLRNTSIPGTINSGSLAGKVDFITWTYPSWIGLCDFNRDLKPDIAVLNANSNVVSFFRNKMPEPSPPVISSFTPASGPVGTAVTITGTNFRAEPAENIVWFGAVQAMVTSATSTQLIVTVPAGATYQPITVTANGVTGYSNKPFNVTFLSTRIIDSTAFALPANFSVGYLPAGIAIGDIDGDGKPDMAIANGGSNTVSIFRNTSTSGNISAGSFGAKVDLTSGGGTRDIVIGDIDGDGKPDLVVINGGSNTISVFRNISTSGSITTASFAARVDFITGTNPQGIAIGDIDGDGKPDLAVANYASNSISVFRNISTIGSITTGSFAVKVDFTTGTEPRGIAIGDFDSDGKPDLCVTNYTSNSVSIFRNTSTSGTIDASAFAVKVDFITGMGPVGVAIGDIDGDNKPDLVVTNNTNTSVSVFRNTSISGLIGPESFQNKVDFTTGSYPYFLSICDIDGDKKPDIAIPNYGDNSVSVFRNTSISGTIGTNSFAARVDFNAGMGSFDIALGDIDGDGKPDLVVTNTNDNTLSVLRNTMFIPVPPVITSFTPSSGPIGTTVTIAGTNFSTTPLNNIVWFGAVQATVTSATATQLTVTVPTGATYQPITVTISGLTAYSSKPFNVTFPSIQNIDVRTFPGKVDFNTGMGPKGIAISDIDGDGKADIIVANQTGNSISVFRNISTTGTVSESSFSAGVDFTTLSSPDGVVASDIDGDGKQDIIVSNSMGNLVSIFRNISTPGSITTNSFDSRFDFTTSTGPIPFAFAVNDIDGDGKPDLVVTNDVNSISVFRNTCTPGSISTDSFAPKVNFSTIAGSGGVATGDIDGDGKPDLVATNPSSGMVSVFRNTSISGSIDLSSLAPKVDFTAGANPTGVVIADIDGDGKSDLVVTNSMNNTISIFRNTSTSGSINSASFEAKVDFNTNIYPQYCAIGDINGDGKPDIVIVNGTNNSVSVLRNTSAPGSITISSFAPKVDFSTGSSPRGVAIGDIDGDTKPDLLVTNSMSNSISVFRNSIPESIIPPPVITSFTPTSGPIGTVVAITGTNFNPTAANNVVWFGAVKSEVTAASDTSLLVAIPTGATYQPISVTDVTTGLTAYFSNPFNVTFPSSRIIDATSFATNVDFSTGTNPYTEAIGDIDGDGKPDLAVANTGSNTVSVYRNISSSGSITSGSFASRVDFPTGLNPWEVVIGDIDGDGKSDLTVANWGSNTVSVFRNTSISGSITASSFAPKVDFTTGYSPVGIAIGDIDGDGKTDMAVTNLNSNTVSIFSNTGISGSITSVSFASSVDFTVGTGPRSIVISDIDGDGKPDLAVTNTFSNTMSIFRNISTSGSITSGSFVSKIDFITGTNPYSVAIGDIDGDRKPDLVVANEGSHTVSVYRNTSDIGAITSGSFAAGVDFITGTAPRSATLCDVDGDDKLDLVAANQASNTVSIFRNTSTSGSIGAGSFATKIDFTTGTTPCIVALGDVDGDGKPDLVVTNYNGSTVSVLRNAISAPVPPAITSFTPSSGQVGTTVTITGTNFSTTPANNIVKFGTLQAVVTAATSTQLTVILPAGSTDNPISVTVNGLTGSSATSFVVTAPSPPPVITSLSQTFGYVGMTLIINGTNFSTTPANNIVWFGAVKANVTAATATQLQVTVPAGATYQPVTVTVNGLTAYSKSPFIVTFPSLRIFDGSTLAPKVEIPCITGWSYFAVLCDIDVDGKPDLIVVNVGKILIYRNTGNQGSISTGSFTAGVELTISGGAYGVAVGDIDGDGKPDIAATSHGNNLVTVLRNHSTPGSITTESFGAGIDYQTGSRPTGIAIGDIDGDGKPDLAVSNYGDGVSQSSYTVSILKNTGMPGSISSGSFAPKVDFQSSHGGVYVAFNDLDMDGKPDLIITTFTMNISIFRNTSTPGEITTGSFAPKVDLMGSNGLNSSAVGDIDGDGKPDLVFVNRENSSISILRNVGTPGSITRNSFSASIEFPTGVKPVDVKLGDIDGDGKPDMVVAKEDSYISLFRNTCSPGTINTGSFASKVEFNTVYGNGNLVIGDIDGDTKPDIVLKHWYENHISILRNNMPFPNLPVINSINPDSGPVGSTITINGSNFSPVAEDNTVMFGTVQGTVTSATNNQLTVIVPVGADDQPVIIMVYGYWINSGISFSVVAPNDIELESSILTLNGDGINEHFVVKNFQIYGASKFYVYNGRGALVYWNDDFQGEWDVTLHNRRFDTGGYFYVIETSIGTFRGSFSILK